MIPQIQRTFATVTILAALLLAAPLTIFAAPQKPRTEQATFAAGCFWSMEAIFKQLKGVKKVDPGYAGGNVSHPSYEQVETGGTGHAESINIAFDPAVITYNDLLRVLLTVRDPTTVDRQGNDQGPQYRSIIFYRTPTQKKEAENVIRSINAAHIWKAPIVTAVAPYGTFYRAEDYHYDYYNLHPDQSYCKYVIAPEITEFRAKFKPLLKK